jgi:CCR4-NOT transcription complex subunit 4
MPEPAIPVKTPASSPKKVDPKPEPAKKVKEKERQPVQEVKPAPLVEQPAPPQAPPEPWRSHNTVDQLIKDAEESGRPIKDLFVERTKSLHEVLAEMHMSGELDLNKSSLFNPANLGQRTDMKGVDSDYFLLKQPLELFESHRRALMRGQPVRIDAEQLSDRCLITPRGCVLRHLSAEEEDRYLELEKQRGGAMDPFVVGDDSSNINGGLDALFATPEKYNICWVDDNSTHMGSTSPAGTVNGADSVIPPNVLSAMEADSERSHDWAVAHSAELLQTTTAAVRSFAAATAKQMLGSAGVPGANPSLDDVAAMTNEELKELAGQSQKELESNRKELDMLDKKLAALLRRNKKIQLAALALAEEA